MKITRRVRILGLVMFGLFLAGAACTAPTGTSKTWQEVCAPAETAVWVVVNPLVVPAGAWLSYTWRDYYPPPGEDVFWDTIVWNEGDLVVGEALTVDGIDAGLCAHLSWSGGLHFTTTLVPTAHLWGATSGWPPGWTGPPAP